ncbi:MAG: SDR family oxidoreductase [Thermomicrobiales bacterium]
MELRVDGKVAIITGADSGIGRGIALRLAESGADVMICYYSDRDGAEQTAADCRAFGRRTGIAQGDIGNPAVVRGIFEQLDLDFGRVDIVVNNAGIGMTENIVDQPFEDFERVMRTNLYGPWLFIQQAGRRMISRNEGGRIINITSVHEEACTAGASGYNCSKGALRNLTRTAAAELGPHGITVNTIAPGMILTPMNFRAISEPEYLEQAEAQIVMRRAGLPEDVANMALFLASDQASYCTGQTHFVDGGWMLTWPPV